MTLPPRHALVLSAGLGTRLQPLTTVRAKPALPVAGEPLIRRIARWLAGHGITDVVMNLHHLPSTVTAAVGEGQDLGVRVRYSWEHPVVLGTAGGPRQALPLIGSDVFLIVNGDTLHRRRSRRTLRCTHVIERVNHARPYGKQGARPV